MNKKSGHWTNTGMAKFINDNLYNYKSDDEKSMNPFRWYRLQNGDDVSKYRETINGFPCRLILINDGSTPLNEGQNEPTPGNTKDMGIFNFNNDKDNVTTLGFNSDIFPNCASYEVTANSDTSAGAFMSYKPTIKACIDPEATSRTWLSYIATEGVNTIKLQNPYILTDTTYLRFNFYRNLEESAWDGMTGSLNTEADISKYSQYPYFNCWITGYNKDSILINNTEYKIEYVSNIDELKNPIILGDPVGELKYLKESFELRHPNEDDVAEDWGYMGVETTVKHLDYWIASDKMTTTRFSYSDTSIEVTGADVSYISCYGESGYIASASGSNGIYTMQDGTTNINITFTTSNIEKFYINGVMYIPGTTANMNTVREPYDSIGFDTSYGLKALIDWVDNCTDEEFVADFEEHFHKDYTLRYFCLVTLVGAVDNLG